MSIQKGKDYKILTERVIADERYQKNIEYQQPEAGHPEGKVKHHILDLEANLEKMKHRLSRKDDYWKLKFLIHIHDIFKVEASKAGVPANHPRSHESLARAFANEFTDDPDLLNIIQYHDENYTLWKQYKRDGHYDKDWLKHLLHIIHDWDLYLAFTIIDGHTEGKDLEKLAWFIGQVRQHKKTQVDESWVSLNPKTN
jgi:hypothetical protein